MTAYRTALTSAHITALLFGLTGIFGALIHASASVITFGRAAFALLALAVFAHLQDRALLRGLNLRKLSIYALSGLMLAAHWVTFFIAIKVGGVAVATLGFASFPAFITLLDMAVFRDRPHLAEALLLLLVTLGLVLVTPSFELANQGTVGLLWGLASGLSFALLAMTNRRATDGRNGVQVVFWQNATVAAIMAPFAVFDLVDLGAVDWTHLAILGVLCTAVSQALFVKSLKGLNARSAGMIISLEPVYAIACAWWLFHEAPSWRMLAGAALIVLAILMSEGKSAAVTD
ncbi:DMT family transporter [Pseudomonas sp. Marseille-Q1929]|uniref:DMT family transporter n=1 Tax=Pseudomonas sp. Marseille-Q1929 TaxID=2730402 RepID=UPI001A8CA61E|nr:DMT family transporter [Pseudomonas sp. Marseille-Q1929]MBO0493917.1 DMT family transporter [Pseudomonas sp. Marseille-Q1929]